MPELAWVQERASCSLIGVFETLKLQVQEDVKMRNETQPQLAGYKFVMLVAENSFKVYIDKTIEAAVWGNKPLGSVKFDLCEKTIEVTDKKGKLILEAALTLNDLGECRVKINGQERELWQMRRAALEDLFFNTL